MATTFLDFAQQEYDIYAKTLKPSADAALATAQTALTKAQTDRDDATKKLAKLEQEVGDIRKKLGKIPLPADGQALLIQLEEDMIAMRATHATIIDAEDAAAVADARVKRARADLTVAVARLGETQSALDAAKARATQLDAWTKDLGKPPLSDLPATAKDARDPAKNDDYKKAKARVENDIPKDLRDRADERGDQARQRVKAVSDAASNAETRQAAERNAPLGAPVQALAKAQSDFDAAEAALREYMTRGRERYDLAVSMLSRIVSALPLTDAEKQRINDPAVVARGTAALPLEKARDGVLATAEDKRLALDDAILTALTKAPADDPEQDNGVKQARQAVTDAEADLAKADKPVTMSALEKARDDTEKARADKQKEYDDLIAGGADSNAQASKDLEFEVKKATEKAAEAKKAFDDADQARAKAQADFDALTTALQDARTEAKAKVPPVDPESDPKVQAAKVELAKAANELAKAKRPLISVGGDLDVWEAAVPDTSWRMLADFEAADRMLTDLGNTDPAKLLKDVKDTEAALVAEREKASKSARALVIFDGTVTERRARRDRARATADVRVLSALRGDR